VTGSVARLRARARGLAVPARPAWLASALCNGPARRPGDPLRRPHVRSLGARWPCFSVRARRGDRREPHGRADGAAARKASTSAVRSGATAPDDDQERRGRLLLPGKGAALGHRLARPLAAASDDGCCFYVNWRLPTGVLQWIVMLRGRGVWVLVRMVVVGSGWSRCQTRRARWRLRQRMASRRVLPSACLRAR
jgi:hypothetical protein